MAKSRHDRLQHIGDARIELEDQDLSIFTEENGKDSQWSVSQWHKWAWMGVALLMFVVGYFMKPQDQENQSTKQKIASKKLEFLLGKNHFLNFEDGRAFSISPDGTRLAYVIQDEENDSSSLLHIRHMDQLISKSLNIDVQNNAFTFSPDSAFIAFAHDNKLKTIPITGGGDIKTICDAPRTTNLSWETDGHIYFCNLYDGNPIHRVSEYGGSPEPITKMAEEDIFHFAPHLLPDGNGLLYTVSTGWSQDSKDWKLMLQPLPDGEAKLLKESAHSARYEASTKTMLYVSDSNLYSIGFNLDSQETTGNPHILANHLLSGSGLHSGDFYDISNNGLLCYLTGKKPSELYQFEWIDRAGESQSVNLEPRSIISGSLSPNGQQLAITQEDDTQEQSDIHIYDFQNETLFDLTSSPENEWKPTWSPDGKSLVYTSDKDDLADMYWRRLNLEGDAEPLLSRAGMQGGWDWHPSGKHLSVFSDFNLIVIELESHDKLGWSYKNDLETNIPEGVYISVSFSPNWKWFAYVKHFGTQSIFVKPFNEEGEQQHLPLNIKHIRRTQWSADGESLLFCGQHEDESESLQIYTLSWDKELGQFASTSPAPWPNGFTADTGMASFFQYDAKSDRILVMKKVKKTSKLQLNHVILHENYHSTLSANKDK
ncbi:hypothetical protein OAM01_02265 [bacterium]|nr:hypothetical protein [bacterium]